MAQNDRLLTMLGFAARARGLVVGETGCLMAVSSGKAQVVILASDAGPNTTDRFERKCNVAGIPLFKVFDRDILGNAIGKPGRVCVAVTSAQFARPILEALGEKSSM